MAALGGARLAVPVALVASLALSSCSSCKGESEVGESKRTAPLVKAEANPTPWVPLLDPPALEPAGDVGGACDVDGDCLAEGAVCLSDGFPRGTCTLACDGECGDGAFCAASHQLPQSVQWVGEGACLPSCDYGRFQESGCRAGYGCVPLEAAAHPEHVRYACLPGVGIALDGARKELASLGVSFAPVEHPDTSPANRQELRCSVVDAVLLRSPLLGLELSLAAGDEATELLASAEMAVALAEAARELRALGVKKLLHLGTFNCRPIRGTDILSRHGQANAIDVYGFELDDGSRYTVKKHWEKRPSSKGGKLLASIIERLVGTGRWKVVLTPAYDADHQDHLHLDVVTDPADPAAFLKRWPKSVAD